MKKFLMIASALTLPVVLTTAMLSSGIAKASVAQALAQATRLPIPAGSNLPKGMKLASPSGNHLLVVGNDGNMMVVTRNGTGYVWGTDQVIPNFGKSTATVAARVEFRSDGSLVSYNDKGVALWTAPVTRRDPNARLNVTDDGILQLTTPNEILWASKGAVGPLNQNLPNTPTGAALTVEQQAAQSFRSNAAFDKPIDAEKPDYALLNAAVYSVTNEARVKQGKSAIPYHPLLAKAAFDYAREMVTKDFFSHDHPSDPAQRTPSDRGKRAGIKNASLAENILNSFGIQYEAGKPVFSMDATKGVISYTSPEGPAIPMHTYRSLAQSLVDWWMKSPGHRANILSDNSRSLGCGVWFYRDRNFSNVLKVKAVQKFQLFNDVKE